MQIFWAIVFLFAAYGVWAAANSVIDWINADDDVDVTRLDSGAGRAKRNTRPVTPSGKTASKRGAKAGK